MNKDIYFEAVRKFTFATTFATTKMLILICK